MRTSNIVIRRATPADVEAVGRLGAVLLRVHYDFDRLRFMRPGVRGRGVRVAPWKELREEACFIHDVLVTDEHRGAGVGHGRHNRPETRGVRA